MKFLIKSFVLLLLLAKLGFAEDSNSAKHFGFSAIFGYASESYIHNKYDLNDYEKVGYSTIIGSLPGLAKELTDTKYDGEDMAFNVAGAFAGSLLSNYLNNTVFISFDETNGEKKVKIASRFVF